MDEVTLIRIIAETVFSKMVKLNAKYGNVNAKLTAIILISAANIPYKYPSVVSETKKTANTKSGGMRDGVLKKVCMARLIKKNIVSMIAVEKTDLIIFLCLNIIFLRSLYYIFYHI